MQSRARGRTDFLRRCGERLFGLLVPSRFQVVPAEQRDRCDERDDCEGRSNPEGDAEPAGQSCRPLASAREQVLGPGRRDGRQNRDSERPADLLGGVDQPRREPGFGARHSGQRRDRDRHEGEAHPDPDQEEAGEKIANVGASHRDLAEEHLPIPSSTIPVIRTGFTPSLVTSACEAPAATTAVRATAR